LIKDQPLINQAYAEGSKTAKSDDIDRAIEIWKNGLNYTMLTEVLGAILFKLGLTHERKSLLDQAIEYCPQSADSNPAQYNAICNFGVILNRQRQHEKILNYLLTAVESNPQYEITLKNLAICYHGLGQDQKAAQILKRLEK